MADGTTLPNTAVQLSPHRQQDRVIIVTGAGGAIGLETSSRLLQEGAKVSLVDINGGALEAAVTKLKTIITDGSLDSRILTIIADVTVEDDVQGFVARTVERFQRLDSVFLNAGISYSSTSIFDTTEESYEKIMRVNVKSGTASSANPPPVLTSACLIRTPAFLGIKHAGMAMRDLGKGGSIILTSSIAGLRGTPGLILYSGSKFALRGLALTAASELGHLGIRVNTVHPSGVNGPMFQASWSPEKLEELKKGMPLGRFAEADDVAGVVSFLVSDDSKFMTGGFLKVDGGCVSF
jgi:NAD(P)-dependent dehydrogenase (short-subunit alcohol dehydrogenase family)